MSRRTPADAGDLLPDSVARHPALAFAPPAWRPYVQLARLDRPIGWWLLLLPCWWSSALASVSLGQEPRLAHLVLFLIGAVAMRGAGSTFNDVIDRDIDAKVARTRGRPIPSGRVSPKQAAAFLAGQCAVGLAVLLCFDRPAVLTGFASLIIVAVYPFAKRFTSWPQAVLGLAFAWGGLIGWIAITGHLQAPALLLYAAAIAWTIGYDTIYAVQDQRDDPAAGVLSTARLFESRVKLGVGLFFRACRLPGGRGARDRTCRAFVVARSASPPSPVIWRGSSPCCARTTAPWRCGCSGRTATRGYCSPAGCSSMRWPAPSSGEATALARECADKPSASAVQMLREQRHRALARGIRRRRIEA